MRLALSKVCFEGGWPQARLASSKIGLEQGWQGTRSPQVRFLLSKVSLKQGWPQIQLPSVTYQADYYLEKQVNLGEAKELGRCHQISAHSIPSDPRDPCLAPAGG